MIIVVVIVAFSAKIVIHLYPVTANKEPGPYQQSKFPYIKLSFKEHGQIEVGPMEKRINCLCYISFTA